MKTFNHVYESADLFASFAEGNELQKHENVLIQIFSGVLNTAVLREAVSSVSKILPKAKIIGTTTDGEIVDGQVRTQSIVISCSVFEKTTMRSGSRAHGIHDSFRTGAEIAKKLVRPETKLVILFSDGLKTNGEELMRGFQSVNADVIVAGGLAGDNAIFEKTYVFTESDFLESGVVGIALDNPELSVTNDYAFDWLSIGKKLTITHSVGNRVYTIDGMLAHDVYEKYLGEDVSEKLPALGVEFPLIFDRHGIKMARAVVQTHDDRSLTFSGTVATGEKAQFGLGNVDLILQSSSRFSKKLMKKPAESVFVYSCMARRHFMGQSVSMEIAPLQDVADSSGFFTYGEFFHTNRRNVLFNETMTVLAISENAEKSAEWAKFARASQASAFVSKTGRDYLSTVRTLSHLITATSTELESLNRHLKREVEKKAEEISASQQAYLEGYKHIIDHVPIAIWMGDHEDRGIYANAKFLELAGCSLDDIVGKVTHNFWTQEAIACVYPPNPNAQHEEQNLIHEGEFLSQDGRIVPIRLTLMPVANAGKVWMMVDMREVRALEEEKRHLQHMSKVKDDFINVASHELRTPLTSIKGYLSMMLDEDFGELSSEVRRVANVMLDSSNRLIHMIGDMLDTAKLESGKATFRSEPFSIGTILNGIFDEYTAVAKRQQLELHCEILGDALVHADGEKFRQVVINLLGNAMKFTPKNGLITLRSMLVNSGKRIKIEVVDTGIGIRKKDQELIFSKFWQVDNALNRMNQGTGLGLTISREIVSLMGGKLQLESMVGHGSNFHFTLPVWQENAPQSLSGEKLASPTQQAYEPIGTP